jgi:hypothetical protein
MSSIVDLLERMGRDADLRHVSGGGLSRWLAAEPLDAFARKALVAGEQRRLEFLAGAVPVVCCLAQVPQSELAVPAPETATGTATATAAEVSGPSTTAPGERRLAVAT